MIPLALLILLTVSGLVWLSILIYCIAHRGLWVFLVWLFISPIALNVFNKPGTNPFFGQSRTFQNEAPISNRESMWKKKTQSGYLSNKGATIRLTDILEPTRVLLLVMFAAYILNCITKRTRMMPLNWTEGFMLLFIILVAFSVLLHSWRVANGIRIMLDCFLVPFLAYFMTRRLVTSVARLNKLTLAMTYMGMYLVILVGVERMLAPGLLHRLSGPFPTDNYLYIALISIFFLLLADSEQEPMTTQRSVLSYLRRGVIVFIPLAIILTWARSNWLGFFTAIWVFGFFARHLVPFSRKVAATALILLFLPIAGISAHMLSSSEQLIKDRVGRTSTIYSRLAAWQIVLEEGLKRPLFGIGLKNSEYVLGSTRRYFMGIKNLSDPHNGFLSLFAELGITGLLGYAAIIFSLGRLGLQLYRRGPHPSDRWRGISILGLLTAYLIPVLTTTILYVPTVCHVYVFACIGSIAGVYSPHQKKSLKVFPTLPAARYRNNLEALPS